MADTDQQHDVQQDEAPVLDLEVPEDEARSVEGGTPNIMKPGHDTTGSISSFGTRSQAS